MQASNQQFVFKVKPNCDGENLQAVFHFPAQVKVGEGIKFRSLKVRVGGVVQHEYEDVTLHKFHRSVGSGDLVSHEVCRQNLKEDGSLEVIGEWTAVEKDVEEKKEGLNSWVLQNLFYDGIEYPDFTLVCNDGAELTVHRPVLRGASDFFKAMLGKENLEAIEGRGKIDCTHVIGRGLVRFLYTGDIASSDFEKNALDFLKLGDQYNLEHLKEKAEASLIRSLKVKNMVEYVIAGDNFNARKLKNAAKKMIKSKIVSYIEEEEDEWKEMFSGKKDLLIEILASVD